MRLHLLTAAAALCLFAIPNADAAHQGTASNTTVWIEGSWVSQNGCNTWRPGYWHTSQTTVCTTPPPQYVEGHWAQGPQGWVWIEGHYDQSPTVCTTTPTYHRPHTTVVIGGSYGHGYSSGHVSHYGHNGYYVHQNSHNHSGVYVGVGVSGHNNGHHNGHHGNSSTVVVAPPRPVIVRPPTIHAPKLPSLPSVKLPSLPKLPKLPKLPFK